MLAKLKRIPYPGAIAVSYGSMFVEGALTTIIVALMAILAAKFGKTSGDIATLLSLKSFGTLLVLFFAGKFSDRVGRKLPIALGSILFSVFMLGFIFSHEFWLASIFAFIAGLAHGMMDTPGMSLLFDALSGNTGPALSVVQVFFAGGSVTTTLLTSTFIRFNLDYRLIFAIILLINLALFTLILKADFPKVAGQVKMKPAQFKFAIQPKFFKEGSFILFNTLLYSAYQAVLSTWLPTFVLEVKGYTLANSITTLSISQIGAITGALSFAWILRKSHSSTWMAINPILATLALGLLYFATSNWLIVISIFSLGFLLGTFFSMSINMGGELFPQQAGAATGAVATASMVGSTFVTWVSGRLIGVIGVKMIFVFSLGALMLLAVSTNIFRHHYLKLKPERSAHE